MRGLTWAFGLLCVFMVACGGGQPSVEARARSIEARVWSPYCPGRLLVDCTTPQARELRDEILQRMGAGQSADDVVRWIRDNHGDAALAEPLPRGAGLAIWLAPVAIFATGAVVVGLAMRRWRRTPGDAE